MKQRKAKEATIPPVQGETIRHAIIILLVDSPASARDLSQAVRIPEKEVYAHLEHIRRSAPHEGRHLEVTPAQCKRCGYLFQKRDRLTPPGRCPLCRHEAIAEPLFSLR